MTSVMTHRIVGHKDDATMIIEFYSSGKQLLYLTGTPPIFKVGLTLEKAKEILTEAGFEYTVENGTQPVENQEESTNKKRQQKKEIETMSNFEINAIIRPLATADSEYSVCGNSVLRKAKVVETFPRKANGNNIKIEILEHVNPDAVGKKYSVDDRFFEAVEQEWIWVDAYKGTDATMRCKTMQYAMGVKHTYVGKVVLGSKGFHVCTDLKHCFKTYDYDFKNRFFKVRALVNAKEYRYRNPNNTTLVAKEIQFVEEITNEASTITAKRNSML